MNKKKQIDWELVGALRRYDPEYRRELIEAYKCLLDLFGIRVQGTPRYKKEDIANWSPALVLRKLQPDEPAFVARHLAKIKATIELVERDGIQAAKEKALQEFALIKRGEWRPEISRGEQLTFSLVFPTVKICSHRASDRGIWSQARYVRDAVTVGSRWN